MQTRICQKADLSINNNNNNNTPPSSGSKVDLYGAFIYFLIVSICLFFYQYPALSNPYKFILITVLILMTLIEIIRLFLGYAGNLQEKVLHHSHINRRK